MCFHSSHEDCFSNVNIDFRVITVEFLRIQAKSGIIYVEIVNFLISYLAALFTSFSTFFSLINKLQTGVMNSFENFIKSGARSMVVNNLV